MINYGGCIDITQCCPHELAASNFADYCYVIRWILAQQSNWKGWKYNLRHCWGSLSLIVSDWHRWFEFFLSANLFHYDFTYHWMWLNDFHNCTEKPVHCVIQEKNIVNTSAQVQYIPWNMHMVIFCFLVLTIIRVPNGIKRLSSPYSSKFFHWHRHLYESPSACEVTQLQSPWKSPVCGRQNTCWTGKPTFYNHV